MFSWVEGVISSIASSIGGVFEGIGDTIVNAIWDNLMKWLFNSLYDAIADVFTQMGGMGAEIFDLSWIESAVRLFFLCGWVLFGVGVIVAAFDLAIEYQNGRSTIKSTMLNVLKGFFAANLVTVVPVELYKFCISLQNVFLKDLASDFVGTREFNLGEVALKVLAAKFGPPTVGPAFGLINLLTLVALAYCVLKVFFANIKRGGILLIQMAVGSLYLFSVPRGYTDGFSQWCKQIFALCLTAFLQTVLLFLGLLTFQDNMLLGLGVMLAAGELSLIHIWSPTARGKPALPMICFPTASTSFMNPPPTRVCCSPHQTRRSW